MMKKAVVVLFGGLLCSCSTPDDSSDTSGSAQNSVDFDRAEMLAHWADNIILPAYADFSLQLDQLETAADAFVDTPDIIQLAQLQEKWAMAYETWQKVSMFEIGPAETLNYRLQMNIYPVDRELIQSNILADNYNLELPSNRVAKGFPALDYMLFGLAEQQQEILILYVGEEGALRRAYLTSLVADMKSLHEQVLDGWENGYRDSFVSNDGSSSTASVDRFVNDFIYYYEKHLRAGKMGIPAGVFSGDVLLQNLEGCFHGSISKRMFLVGLQATQDFFNGKAYASETYGPSLSAYLDALNVVKEGADLSAVINTQIDEARSEVQDLDPFKVALQQNPPVDFLEAYDEVQRLVPLLKVDMVSALSITIDFVDADGD
ncbi:MAG: imelysin family protein [Flavobacteriaceae bacterium]